MRQVVTGFSSQRSGFISRIVHVGSVLDGLAGAVGAVLIGPSFVPLFKITKTNIIFEEYKIYL
jgi:hypothetical protein